MPTPVCRVFSSDSCAVLTFDEIKSHSPDELINGVLLTAVRAQLKASLNDSDRSKLSLVLSSRLPAWFDAWLTRCMADEGFGRVALHYPNVQRGGGEHVAIPVYSQNPAGLRQPVCWSNAQAPPVRDAERFPQPKILDSNNLCVLDYGGCTHVDLHKLHELTLPEGLPSDKPLLINGRLPQAMTVRLSELAHATLPELPAVVLKSWWPVDNDGMPALIVPWSCDEKYPVGAYDLTKHTLDHTVAPVVYGVGSTAPPGATLRRLCVAIVGPQHTGKTQFRLALGAWLIDQDKPAAWAGRMNPDHDGEHNRQTQSARASEQWTADVVSKILSRLKAVREHADVVFFDAGGKVSPEQKPLMDECTHAILLASQAAQNDGSGALLQWVEFLQCWARSPDKSILAEIWTSDTNDLPKKPEKWLLEGATLKERACRTSRNEVLEDIVSANSGLFENLFKALPAATSP